MWSTLRKRRYLGLMVVALLAAGLCSLAGTWQYHRWEEKRFANRELKANIAAAPVPVAQLLSTGTGLDPAHRMREVSVRGRYLPDTQRYVRQRQVDTTVGFFVLTALRTDAGPALMVVRGWVAAGDSATQTPTVAPPPAGPVTITARAYPSEPGGLGSGLPPGQIQQINAAALGREFAVTPYLGYVTVVTQQPAAAGVEVVPPPDTTNPAGGAQEWQHLSYVVQWYILAVMALAAPLLLARFEAAETPRGAGGAAVRPPREETPAADRYGRRRSRPSVAARLSQPDP